MPARGLFARRTHEGEALCRTEVAVDVVWIMLAVMDALAIAAWFATVRVVKQVERGVVFRLGRAQPQLRRPGITLLIPAVDRMTRVNVQVVTMPVPASITSKPH